MKFKLGRTFKRNVGNNGMRSTRAGETLRDLVTVTSSGVGSPGQMRSFMSQLQMAMGHRFAHIHEVNVAKGVTRYFLADSLNKPLCPDEPTMHFSLKTENVTLATALQISADIRRTDTWRECWASVMADKLTGGSEQ